MRTRAQCPGGFIQVDGVAAEFNVAPSLTAKEFSQNIFDILGELQSRVEAKGLKLYVTPTAHFEQKYFKKLPAYARRLGCEPDFNVYNQGRPNKTPKTRRPIRTGAGHIHVGWTAGEDITSKEHIFDIQEATRNLDAVLYPVSLLWDQDDERRTLYGKMGSYRPKHYGVEYRPLSNAWVADPDLHIWVFEATMRTMRLLDEDKGVSKDEIWGATRDDLLNDNHTPDQIEDYYHYLVDQYHIPALPPAYRPAK